MTTLATCVHEAGHAVVANELGMLLKLASVIRNGDTLGYVKLNSRVHTVTLAHNCTFAMAGRAAESVLLGSPGHITTHGGDLSGLEQCSLTAIESSYRAAKTIIRKRRADVLALTAQLAEHKVLSGAQVSRILDKERSQWEKAKSEN